MLCSYCSCLPYVLPLCCPVDVAGSDKRSTEAKFATLNSNSEPWGYNFNLKGVTIVISAEWASCIEVELYEKHKAMRRGG
jgi:hypothetical protein